MGGKYRFLVENLSKDAVFYKGQESCTNIILKRRNVRAFEFFTSNFCAVPLWAWFPPPNVFVEVFVLLVFPNSPVDAVFVFPNKFDVPVLFDRNAKVFVPVFPAFVVLLAPNNPPPPVLLLLVFPNKPVVWVLKFGVSGIRYPQRILGKFRNFVKKMHFFFGQNFDRLHKTKNNFPKFMHNDPNFWKCENSEYFKISKIFQTNFHLQLQEIRVLLPKYYEKNPKIFEKLKKKSWKFEISKFLRNWKKKLKIWNL